MLNIPEKITINDCNFNVLIEYKKKKTSSARVCGDKIVLRISNRISKSIQKEHISILLKSITNKLIKRPIKADFFNLDLTQEINILGKSLKIELIYEPRKTCKAYFKDDNTIIIHLPDNVEKKLLNEPLKIIILKVLSIHYQDLLVDFVSKINEKHFKHKINSIKFKFFKSKWGQCTTDKQISINTLLLFCPLNIFEYIVIHELAHINMMNHSKEYWDIVEKVLPDRKFREKWLKDNGTNIFNLKICY